MKKYLLLSLIFISSLNLISQNNCLEFDGADDYVTCGTINLSGSSITLEAWVKVDNFQSGYPYISSVVGTETTGNTALLRLGDGDIPDGNKVQFILQFGGEQTKLTSTSTLETGHWYHIAGVYDGSNMKIYINGILDVSISQGGSFTSNSAFNIANNSSRYLDGTIDELRIWNDARTETEIRQNMYRELPNPSSEGNLVAYYKMNETSGTTADDSKGSNNGTLTNMSGSEWQTSPAMFGPKNCLEFDGVDDYVKVNTTLSPAFTQGTISFWIKPKAIPSNHARVFSDYWDDDEIYLVSGAGNVATWHMIDGDELISSNPLPLDTWTHVAITMDNSSSQLYINGVLDDESGPSDTDISTNYEIGGYSTSGNYEVINGYLDEFRIWSDVRTATEIRDNMCKSLTGNEANLLAYYNFDNTSGAKLQDFSGNGNDGTCEGYVGDFSGTALIVQDDMLYDWDQSWSVNEFVGKTLNLGSPINASHTITGNSIDDLTFDGYYDPSIEDVEYTILDAYTDADWASSSAFNTWLNTSSSDWTVATNWSNGAPPTAEPYDNIGIYSYSGGTDLIIAGSRKANNAVIGSNATLTFDINSNFYVFGDLFIENNIDISNGIIGLMEDNSTLYENGGVIYGTSGYIATFFRVMGTLSSENIAGLGAVLTTDIDIGQIQIARMYEASTNPTGINRNYQIIQFDQTNDLNATLVYHYNDLDLNGQTEADLKLYRNNSDLWERVDDAVLNTNENTITTTGINSFFTIQKYSASEGFKPPGYALDFDGGLKTGSPDYASKSSNVSSATDNFTMMAWIRPNVVTNGNDDGWRCIAYNGSDAGGYGIGINHSKLASLYGGVAWHNTDEVLTADQWHHVALRRSSGTTQFFLDGSLLGYSSTTTPNAPSAHFSIGNMFASDGSSLYADSFDGKIDEVIVFEEALTEQQIADYATTSPTGDETNLVAYYNCDNTIGTTVYAFDGNSANNLTLVNTSNDDWVPSYAMVLAEDATDIKGTSFTANWDSPGENSSYDDGYTIEYSTTSDFSSGNATVTALSSEMSKSITGLSADKTYYYHVSGKRVNNFTLEYSNIKSATTHEAPLYALDFERDNSQYANCGSINLSGSAVTLECWIKAESFQTSSPYISQIMGTEEGSDAAFLRLGDGDIPEGNKIQFALQFGGSQVKLTSTSILETNRWYHIAGVYDGVNMKIYIDGAEDASNSQTGSLTSNSTFYISTNDGTGRYFDGTIEEARVWKSARTSTDLINNMTTILDGNETNLEAYYRFDNGSGTALNDITSNHNATLSGTPTWVNSYAMVLAEDATDVTETSFTANWDCPAEGISSYDDGFTIQYSTSSDFSSGNATETALSSETSKAITGLSASTTYYYRVSGKRSGISTLEYSNVKSTTTSTPEAPKFALDFERDNSQYANCGTIDLSGSAITLECWIKPESFQTDWPYISQIAGTEAGSNAAFLRLGDSDIHDGNKIEFSLYFGSAQVQLTSSSTLETGRWYHIAGVYDGSNMKIYIDGMEDASNSQTGGFTSNSTFYIATNDGTGRYFDGTIDEARVWKSARTSTELINNMTSLLDGDETGLEAYYRFDDGSGTTLSDITSNGNNGTLVNSPSWVNSYAMVLAEDATVLAENSFTVNWDCPISGGSFDDGFTIQYSTNPDLSGASTTTALSSETSKSITGLTAGTTYYYSVSGKRTGSATLEYSNIISVTTVGEFSTIVTSDADDGGHNTLRYIIANCDAGDNITFDLDAGSETITLGSQLTIAKSMTIDGSNDDGSGVDITVQAATTADAANYRVLSVNSDINVTLQDMTIRHGNIAEQGGGIYNNGYLTINRCSIEDNNGTWGGGIYTFDYGWLHLNESTVSGNSATTHHGGGIFDRSDYGIIIKSSTISHNTSDGSGGGITISSAGAASSTIENTTIANNENGSSYDGALHIYDSDIAIRNTIIANNTVGYDYYYDQIKSGRSGITDNGYNVVKNSYNATAYTGGFNNPTSILYNTKYQQSGTSFSSWTQGGVELANQNLDLAATLADNGGPTQTLALASTSFAAASETTGIPPASNWNDSPQIDGEYTDQRGVVRTASQNTSIGAYSDNIFSPIVTSNADNGGHNTLRYILENCDEGDEITFNLSTGNETITLLTEDIDITKSLTINGDNTAGSGTDVTIQVESPGHSGSNYRVFFINIASGNIASMSNMTIKGGNIDHGSYNDLYRGGGILMKGGGTLNLDDVSVTGSQACNGGGICILSSTLTATNSTVSNCKNDQGGLFGSQSSITLTGCTISLISASNSGGNGIYVEESSSLSIVNSQIVNCTSTYYGAGLYVEYSSLSISESTIANNTTSAFGGGISTYYATFTITDCNFENNSASSGGGAVEASDYGISEISNCTFSNNEATNNYSTSKGGGLYLSAGNDETYLAINNTTISNNSGDQGGGICVFGEWANNVLSLVNSTISGNTCDAIGYGGGIYAYKGPSGTTSVYLTNSIVAYNIKENVEYEDIYQSSSSFYGTNSIIGDFTLSGNNNTNYTYSNGTGSALFYSYTEEVPNLIYKPDLADNGGSTETVALASNSIAVGSGVRTGKYESSGTKYVFYDVNKWVKVEDGTTEVESGVTEITTDQRDDNRRQESPCKGSFECENYNQIWTGNNSSSWESADNWSPNAIPISTDDITIPEISSKASTLTIGATETADCNNLTIDANANLTIESTSSGTGSLIVHGTLSNSGTITSQSYLEGASQAWHMVSGPAVVDISDSDWQPDAPNNMDDFYAWKETSPGIWVNYKNTSSSPTFAEVNGSDNFVAAKGYLVAYESANPTKTFTGTLNTGNKTFNLQNSGGKNWTYVSGWNLMGNPYSSSIDWNLATRTQFQDEFAYMYDPNKDGGAGYVYVNGESPDAYIPPHQGFFVIASQAAHEQSFTFTNSMQTHGSGSNVYKTTNNDDVLVLRLNGNNHYDETNIILDEQSSFNRDRRDAIKMFSYNASVPQLYSISNNEIPLAINSIPEINTTKSVPLGISISEQGIYSISIGQLNETIGVAGIYLEDHALNSLHKLSDSEYSFMSESGDITDRFTIHFGIVGIEESTTKIATIQSYASNNTLYIINPQQKQGTVSIYNLTGKIVTIFRLTGDTKQQHHVYSQQRTLNTNNMINIVKIQTNNEVISEKVVFK